MKNLKRWILAAAAMGAAGSIVFMRITSRILIKYISRDDDICVTPDEKNRKYYEKYREQYFAALTDLENEEYQTVNVTSHDGCKLTGRLYRCAPGNDKVVLAMHGYHGGGLYDMARFAAMYRRAGFDFLLISQRCHEQSEGEYISFGYLEKNDGLAWCDLLSEIYGSSVSILLHGVSMGAATALMMTGEPLLPDSVKGCIADCSYTSLLDEARYYFDKSMPSVVTETILAGLNYRAKRNFGFDMRAVSPVRAVTGARIPALFIHGAADRLVPLSMMHELKEAYAALSYSLIVPNAAHAHSFVVSPDKYEKYFKAFAEKALRQ